MRIFYRLVRLVSAITLFFFCWTYLSVYQVVAFAAEEQKASHLKQLESAGVGQQTREDRFEETLDNLRTNIAQAQEKITRGEDAALEVETLKTGKAVIESVDVEFKKEFAETEKKLKDANLPQEILDRHYKFVKQYETNLKEFKSNIDGIEKPGTKTERLAKIEKAKLHLEKVKPQKKHVPLDPNKLPHRTVKAKERAPRLKKEEFEKEFGPLTSDKMTLAFNSDQWNGVLRPKYTNSSTLLAFNGPDSDIPLARKSKAAFAEIAFDPAFVALAGSPLLLAQAVQNLPTPADLAETTEVQFTPAIRAKALELGHNPVKIYEWVRNTIEFVPTYGSIQGADMCLQTKQCNAFDTASLLTSLLRVSNVPAKYVYGTIEVPIDKLMNWVGGFTDPRSAASFIASGGIPSIALVTGDKITSVRMEHIWVEAWIDYNPSRGVIQREGDTWISLDASFKQFDYTTGADFGPALNAAGLDAEALMAEAGDSADKDEAGLSATKVDSTLLSGRLTEMRVSVLDHFRQATPSANVGDILGRRAVRIQALSILPTNLPLLVVSEKLRFASMPSSLQHRFTVRLISTDFFEENVFSYTAPLATVASNQMTLSYYPATSSDEAVAERYGGILKTPAYLLNLKAFFKVGGVTRTSGGALPLGSSQKLNIYFSAPGNLSDGVEHVVTAGGYYALVLNAGSMSEEQLRERKNSLNAIIQAGQATKDESLGQILYTWGLGYFLQVKMFEDINSRTLGVNALKIGSEGLVFTSIGVSTLFGIPRTALFAGFAIDVKRDVSAVIARDGNDEMAKRYMLTTGFYGSSLENGIFEEVMKTKGVSAIALLRVANDTGVPIYYISKSNLSTTIPKLSLPANDLQDIRNAVNAGKVVYAPQRTIQYAGYSGIGYLVLDPATGAGAYLISGGLGVLHGGSAPPDNTTSALETILIFVRDVVFALLSLIANTVAVAVAFASVLMDIVRGIINGTASASDIAWSIAVWAGATAASLWLASQTLALILTAAIYGGIFLGPLGAVLGVLAAVLLIVALQVALYFLVYYVTGELLLGWIRKIMGTFLAGIRSQEPFFAGIEGDEWPPMVPA